MKGLLAARPSAVLLFGVLVLMVAGGSWAYAAVRSRATITVCVHKGGGQLYQAGRCVAGDHRLSWNVKGPPGPRGRRGIEGLPGVQGPQGPALEFTTATGTTGPTITEAGTYFVDVTAGIAGETSAESGLCAVYAADPPTGGGLNRVDEFDGAYVQPSIASTGSEGVPWDGNFSFSGMFTVPASTVPAQTGFYCADSSAIGPTVYNVKWWIARTGP